MNGSAATAGRVRLLPLAIVAACAGALAVAFASEHLFGLDPCLLCHYQRAAYAAAAGLAMVGVFARGNGRPIILALCAVAFLAGAGTAFYHVGVEQHWWEQTAACAGRPASLSGLSVAELRQQMLAPPPKACDEVDWSLFGISLAGFNVLASLALAGACAVGARISWCLSPVRA